MTDSVKTPVRTKDKIPAEAITHVEEQIKRMRLSRLGQPEFRGRFCYISYNGDPLCRFGYRREIEEWDFAIYKYSTGKYSASEALFPQWGKITDCVKTALHAYNLI
jgi:hypothetical protein